MTLSGALVGNLILLPDEKVAHRPRIYDERRQINSKVTRQSLESSKPSNRPCQSVVDQAAYQLYTLWLFTKSDFATFVFPNCVFGLSGAASSLLTTTINPLASHWIHLFTVRALKTLAFNWLNTLVYDLSNQTAPDAVAEDAVNKPWRPIPSNRISYEATRKLLLASLPVGLLISYTLNCYLETANIYVLTWMCNDLRGGDVGYIVRNLIICVAFWFYNAASLKIAAGPDAYINSTGYAWISIVSLIILTTMHVQDMKDQVGDAQRGRRSVPLVLGDEIARWTIAVPQLFWAVFCPLFWRSGYTAFILCGGVGCCVAGRILTLKTPKADSKTWKLWTLWTAIVYNLPLLSACA